MRPAGGIPRYRPFAGPALFQQGFRPLFLAAASWSALALLIWLATLAGPLTLPTTLAPAVWHGHEMIFGFAGAAVGGFLLTAIPNWTGRLPLQGGPLGGLVFAWAAGRIALALSVWIGPLPAAVIDLSFLFLLLAAVLREIVAGRNWRNLPMALTLGLLISANLLVHLESIGIAETAASGLRLGIATLLMLISLVGGRIIPSFTRNWLVKRAAAQLPAGFGAMDKAALAISAAGLGAWVLGLEPAITGILLIIAAVAAAARLVRWRGYLTTAEPLLWSLHLGYAWLVLGLAMLGLSQAWTAVPATSALHALTAGAIGTMILAVMTRVSLGHTGRPLTAGPGTAIIYLLVTLAAVLRVTASFMDASYRPILDASGAAWIGAFLLFLALYARPLSTPGRAQSRKP